MRLLWTGGRNDAFHIAAAFKAAGNQAHSKLPSGVSSKAGACAVAQGPGGSMASTVPIAEF